VAGKRTYKVTLTDEEREMLHAMLSSGKAAARKLNHARLLLYADEATDGLRRTDQEIAATLGIGLRTVERVRQRFVEEGLASALVPRPRPRGVYKIDQEVETQILAIAKRDPPSGRKRWTLRLIADQLVALNCSAVSPEAVRQVLKKRRDPVAGEDVVYPSQGGCRVCGSDGGSAGVVSVAQRSAIPGGRHG
jgi:transposase